MAAIPLSTVIGAPVSGLLLDLHGLAGLSGWQWLFIIEAVPAVVLGVVVLFYLTDRPADAAWLEPEERAWLTGAARSGAEAARGGASQLIPQGAVQSEGAGARASSTSALSPTTTALGFWLPQIVKAFGADQLPDRPRVRDPLCRRHRRHGVVGPAVRQAAWNARVTPPSRWPAPRSGLRFRRVVDDPTLKMVSLSFAAFGVFAMLPVFWTFPTAFLSGAAAAAGSPPINSIGNLAGFAGPFLMGWLKDVTGSFSAGLLLIAAFAVMAMIVVLLLHHDRTLERAPERQPAE